MTGKGKVQAPGVISFGTTKSNKILVSWLQADPSLVVSLIDVCNDCNCVPSFAVTSDGGAWRVYFLHEFIPKDERSQYCSGTQDLDEWLKEKIDFWEGWRDKLKGPG